MPGEVLAWRIFGSAMGNVLGKVLGELIPENSDDHAKLLQAEHIARQENVDRVRAIKSAINEVQNEVLDQVLKTSKEDATVEQIIKKTNQRLQQMDKEGALPIVPEREQKSRFFGDILREVYQQENSNYTPEQIDRIIELTSALQAVTRTAWVNNAFGPKKFEGSSFFQSHYELDKRGVPDIMLLKRDEEPYLKEAKSPAKEAQAILSLTRFLASGIEEREEIYHDTDIQAAVKAVDALIYIQMRNIVDQFKEVSPQIAARLEEKLQLPFLATESLPERQGPLALLTRGAMKVCRLVAYKKDEQNHYSYRGFIGKMAHGFADTLQHKGYDTSLMNYGEQTDKLREGAELAAYASDNLEQTKNWIAEYAEYAGLGKRTVQAMQEQVTKDVPLPVFGGVNATAPAVPSFS